MRPETDVQNRIRELLTSEFEHRVGEAFEKLPQRCVHNHRHVLDARKHIDGEPNADYNRHIAKGLPVLQDIGLCMYGAKDPETWQGTICEDPIDAQRCPLFTPKETPETIRAHIEQQIRDLSWVQDNMPAVHALLWVIDSEQLPAKSGPTPEPEPPAVVPREPSLEETLASFPRWKQFVCRLLGVGSSNHLRLPSEMD